MQMRHNWANWTLQLSLPVHAQVTASTMHNKGAACGGGVVPVLDVSWLLLAGIFTTRAGSQTGPIYVSNVFPFNFVPTFLCAIILQEHPPTSKKCLLGASIWVDGLPDRAFPPKYLGNMGSANILCPYLFMHCRHIPRRISAKMERRTAEDRAHNNFHVRISVQSLCWVGHWIWA